MHQPWDTGRTAVWMQEARHRAANLQQLAANIDRLPNYAIADPADRPRAALRASALLRAYENLDAADGNACPCTPELVNIAGGLVSVFGHNLGSVVLLLDLQPLELAAERRRALLLAASELLINALRHAFAGRRFGMIQIGLHRDQRQAAMRIADDGIGPDLIGEGSGLGCRIVRGLAQMIDGDIAWRRSAALGGTEAMLNFPLVAPR